MVMKPSQTCWGVWGTENSVRFALLLECGRAQTIAAGHKLSQSGSANDRYRDDAGKWTSATTPSSGIVGRPRKRREIAAFEQDTDNVITQTWSSARSLKFILKTIRLPKRPMMIAPSGEQITIAVVDQQAVIVEVGGGLRSYSAGGLELVDGYGADEMSPSGLPASCRTQPAGPVTGAHASERSINRSTGLPRSPAWSSAERGRPRDRARARVARRGDLSSPNIISIGNHYQKMSCRRAEFTEPAPNTTSTTPLPAARRT